MLSRRWRGAVAALTAVGAVAGVVLAAVLADGREVTRADTHDGGAWLINRDAGAIGHMDRRAGEFTGAVRLTEPGVGFEVEQANGVVLVHDPAAAMATLVDHRTYSATRSIAADEGLELRAIEDGMVAVAHDPVSVRRVAVDQLTELEALTDLAPSLTGEGPGVAVLDRSERVALADEQGTVLHEDDEGEVTTTSVGQLSARPAQLTVVGDVPVVLTEAGELRAVTGGVTTLDPPEDERAGDWVLQQPSPTGSTVVAITPDGVIHELDLDGGSAGVVDELGGGLPLQPIVHQGCLFSVVTQPALLTIHCEDGTVEEPLEVNGRSPQQLRLRLVNGWVWVNDLDSGTSWVTDETAEVVRIDDWDVALSEEEGEVEEELTADGPADEQRENPDDAEVVSVLDRLDLDGPNEPPVARPDSAATREGRPVLVDVLANDTDPNGDVLLITEVDNRSPQDAVVTITGDRSAVQVVPDDGFTGTVRFSYTISDGRGGFDSAEVTVNVTPMDPERNRPPEPVTDVATVRAGDSVTMNVLANDSDPDGDRLHLVEVTGEGVDIVHAPDGTVTLAPHPEQEGRLELEYTVADEFGATATGRILLEVRLAGSNLAPIARNVSAQSVVGNRIIVDALANDSDPDGDRLIVQGQPQVLQAPEGADPFLHLDQRGLLDFEADVAGSYVLLYTISDGSLSDSALIRVEVADGSENRPPVAVRDDAVVAVGSSVIVPVLRNDHDPDGDVLSLVDWQSAPGLVVEEVDGDRFRVTAQPNAPAETSFRYTISDGVNEPVSTIVSVLVVDEATRLPPVARPDEVEVRAGQVSTVPVLDNDHDPAGGPLRIVGVGTAEGAEVSISGDGQRMVLDVAASAERSFTVGYEIENDAGDRAASTVDVRIVPDEDPNRAPVAGTDIARTLAERAVVIDVLANDRDPDGDPISLDGIARQPANGAATLTEDGLVAYTPDRGFTGTDRFAYTISDNRGARATGEVLVGVTAPWQDNRPPQAQDDTAEVVAGNGPTPIDVLANDRDPDGDPLTVVQVGEVRLGGVQIARDGRSVVYTPPDTLDRPEAEVSFRYTIDDGRGGQDDAVVTVTLLAEGPPEPPVAEDDRVGPVEPGDTVRVDVLANDRIPEPSADQITLSVSNPDLQVDEAGTHVVLSAPERTATYRYTITDAFEQSSSATITVEVLENRPPVVEPLQVETPVDEPIELDLTGQASDPDDDELFFACCDDVRGGSVTVLSPDARSLRVRFTPDASPGGRGGFAYVVDDQQGHQVAGSVRVDVLPPDNAPPVAADTEVEVEAGASRSVDLTALVEDDGPTSELRFSTGAVSGPIEVTRDRASLRIRAAVDAAGADGSVGYTVTDRAGEQDQGTVRVSVATSSEPLPEARTDRGRTAQGESVVIPVLDNDLGDGLRVVDAGGSADVNAEVVEGGTAVRLTPGRDFFGETTGSYTIRDRFDDADREVTGRIELFVVGRPGAPAAPRATADSRQATVTWNAPAGNGAPIEAYEIRHDQGEAREIDPTSTLTWTGLTNGTTYRFEVRAINEAGAGEWSAASNAVTPDEVPGRPGRPEVAFGDGELDVTWFAPSNEGTPITSYVLEIGGATTGARELPASPGERQTYTWTGLANGQSHTFRVKAINAADEGGGDLSGWSEPEHPLTQPDAPAQPTLDNGPNYLDISWNRPADGGDAIQEYEIQIDAESGRTVRVSGANTTNYRWGDLTNGVEHRFRVRAWNRDSRGGQWSAFSDFGRACDVPDAPPKPQVVRGDRSVDVSWSAPPANGCEITGYTVWIDDGADGWPYAAGGNATSLRIEGLENGQDYFANVVATNEMGDGDPSPASDWFTPAGPPTQPRITSVQATGEEELTVEWDAADPNGSAIQRYEWRRNGGTVRTAQNSSRLVDSDGLRATETYTYEVRAVNEVGAGAWSNAVSGTAEGRPGTPASLRIDDRQRTSLRWRWNAPASDGGSAITRYEVDRSSNGRDLINEASSARTHTWSGLTAGRTYDIRVRAVNRWGTSAWTSSVSGTTLDPPQPSVSISWGRWWTNAEDGDKEGGCANDSTCKWINGSGSDLPPSSSVSYRCQQSTSTGWSTFWTSSNGGSTNANGNWSRNDLCFFGNRNNVRVVIEVGGQTVTSNSISRNW